jgi:hypothetical protein
MKRRKWAPNIIHISSTSYYLLSGGEVHLPYEKNKKPVISTSSSHQHHLNLQYLSILSGGGDYRVLGVFEIWAVFRYGVFFRYELFLRYELFFEKRVFSSVYGIYRFSGGKWFLGYFARISILPFFPWHAKNRV